MPYFLNPPVPDRYKGWIIERAEISTWGVFQVSHSKREGIDFFFLADSAEEIRDKIDYKNDKFNLQWEEDEDE